MGRGRRAAKSQRCTGFSLLLLLRLFLRLLPPPDRPRRHQPPKYQLNRGDRGAAAVAVAAAARGRVLCSPRSGPCRRAEKVAFPRETRLGSLGSWGRAEGTGSSLPLAPVGRGRGEGTRAGGEGGEGGGCRGCEREAGEGVGGRRLFPGRRCRYFSPPPSSSSESCREPQPKQAAASGSARRPRRRLTREEKKTRDGASALRSPAAAAAAAGRLPPGSLHSRPSPPRARPSPPPGLAAEAPAPGLGTALGQRPYAAGSPGSEPASSRATQGAPRPAGIPAAGAGGGVWVSPRKHEGSLGKRGRGANPGRRRSEGGGRRGKDNAQTTDISSCWTRTKLYDSQNIQC